MEKGKKKMSKKAKIIIIGAIVITVVVAFLIIKSAFNNGNIKSVKRILKEKYYNIECLDSNCNQVAAYKGNPTGESKVTLLKSNGDKVANYSYENKPNAKSTSKPYALGDDFYLSKITNTSSKEVTSYTISNSKGKETYKTKNQLKILTNNLVLMDDTTKGLDSYSVLDKNGKVLFNKINNYDVYANKTIVSIESNGSRSILDEDGELLISDYYVIREVSDKDGKPLYLIIKDTKNNGYNFFSIKEKKKIGDSFQSYIKQEDGSLLVTKKENNEVINYKISTNGKQEKIGVNKTQSQIANEIKNKIDSSKYNIYSSTIGDEKQAYVFADDLENKSFGIYNIKDNKFEKIFDYKKDAKSVYSTVYSLSSEDDKNSYYQVSCSTNSCDKSKFFVYDLSNAKVLYQSEADDTVIQYYYQYSHDYKVIRYSYSSTNKDKKGKYVLLDKNNKELATSTNGIVVLNEKLLLGNSLSTSLLLYSSKTSKILNSDSNVASKLSISDKSYYKYSYKDKVIIVNDKGKEVLKVNSTVSLITSDKLVVYVDNNKINMLNAKTGKVKSYKLKTDEKMNDSSGDLLPPYRGAVFVNNTNSNYFKVLDSKGGVIKKIKNAEIQDIRYSEDKNVIIITRNDNNNINLYGLYIAK